MPVGKSGGMRDRIIVKCSDPSELSHEPREFRYPDSTVGIHVHTRLYSRVLYRTAVVAMRMHPG